MPEARSTTVVNAGSQINYRQTTFAGSVGRKSYRSGTFVASDREQGQRDHQPDAAFHSVRSLDGAAMGANNRLDKCKAQSMAIGPWPLYAALKHMFQNLRGKAGAVVFK